MGGYSGDGDAQRVHSLSVFTITMLNRNTIEFVGEFTHDRDITKWGDDYFLKPFNFTTVSISRLVTRVEKGDTSGGSSTPNDHTWVMNIDHPRPMIACSSRYGLVAEIASALVSIPRFLKDNRVTQTTRSMKLKKLGGLQGIGVAGRVTVDRVIQVCVGTGWCTVELGCFMQGGSCNFSMLGNRHGISMMINPLQKKKADGRKRGKNAIETSQTESLPGDNYFGVSSLRSATKSAKRKNKTEHETTLGGQHKETRNVYGVMNFQQAWREKFLFNQFVEHKKGLEQVKATLKKTGESNDFKDQSYHCMAGLNSEFLKIFEMWAKLVIEWYTRETGVRNLKRKLPAIAHPTTVTVAEQESLQGKFEGFTVYFPGAMDVTLVLWFTFLFAATLEHEYLKELSISSP